MRLTWKTIYTNIIEMSSKELSSQEVGVGVEEINEKLRKAELGAIFRSLLNGGLASGILYTADAYNNLVGTNIEDSLPPAVGITLGLLAQAACFIENGRIARNNIKEAQTLARTAEISGYTILGRWPFRHISNVKPHPRNQDFE